MMNNKIGYKECPHCHEVKEVERDFGYRKMRGRIVQQSWCKTCRGLDSRKKKKKEKYLRK